MEQEIIKQSFNTNPDTVFGLFVAVLLIVIFGLCWFIRHLYSKQNLLQDKYIESLTTVVSANTRSHDKLVSVVLYDRERIKEGIEEVKRLLTS
jgi:cobalamin biosynthesis protein CobD/CbiB